MHTTLSYTVFSQMRMSYLKLYVEGPCSTFGDNLALGWTVIPPGFDINQEGMTCVCDQTLQKHTNHCNGLGCNTFWVGHNHFNELILHPHCPLDYCVNHTVVFPLNNTDVQCTYNRSGLLCGTCNNRGYIVWYWALLTANSVQTSISCYLFLLHWWAYH